MYVFIYIYIQIFIYVFLFVLYYFLNNRNQSSHRLPSATAPNVLGIASLFAPRRRESFARTERRWRHHCASALRIQRRLVRLRKQRRFVRIGRTENE